MPTIFASMLTFLTDVLENIVRQEKEIKGLGMRKEQNHQFFHIMLLFGVKLILGKWVRLFLLAYSEFRYVIQYVSNDRFI